MLTGKIKKLIYPRGFGFLKGPEDGDKDLFFHCSDVEGDFEDLKEGDLITYEIGKGREDRDKAINVKKIEGENEEQPEGDRQDQAE